MVQVTLSPDMRRQLEEQAEREVLLHNLVVTLDAVDRENWTADSMASAMIVLSRELESKNLQLTQLRAQGLPPVIIKLGPDSQ